MEDTGLNVQETRNLIESQDLRGILENILGELGNIRLSALPEGHRWKRSPQDRLLEKGLFKADCIIEEFQKISRRSSNLSSEEREFIKMLVYKAMNQTLISRRRNNRDIKDESHGKED